MLNFIKDIFSTSNFIVDLLEVDERSVLMAKSSHGLSNYLVCEMDEIQNAQIETFSEHLYELAFSSDKWSSHQFKNTILVILFMRDEERYQEDDYSRAYQEVEENKYLFKKHVLSFTTVELNELKDSHKKSALGLVDFLNDQISSHDQFRTFKNNEAFLSGFGLLLKIFIKLPFLSLKIKNLSFSLVAEEISKNVKEKKLEDIQKFALSFKKDLSMEQFLKNMDKLID